MRMRVVIALLASVVIVSVQGAENEPDRAQLERQLAAQFRLLSDWAGLTRYGSDNAKLRLKPDEQRVVFLGDDITDHWGQGQTPFFPGKAYLNRGIAGQTTPQMLVRFRQDVIALKPKVVVIQAGTNDIASVTGPITEAMAAENFMSMAELARVHGIRVVFASLLPVCNCSRDIASRRPVGKILSMNGWLKRYAAETGAVYLDYYSALVDGREFKRALTVDGLLPNDAGYALMAPLAEEAIRKALAQ